jgi:bacterioferritin-associated ferredoxin
MPNNPLFYPVSDEVRVGDFRDQVQIALAIADLHQVKTLLSTCIPPIVDDRYIKAISTTIGVPTGNQLAADGILQFEAVQCVPGEMPQSTEQRPACHSGWTRESRELERLTRHESDLQTLGQNLSLAATVALLAESGFTPKHIEDILRLPHDASHKSWWYEIDPRGEFTIPFLRHIRTLHYPDGTLTIQYKDFFEQDKPPCFASKVHQVLVVIKPDHQCFGETLRQINYQRAALEIQSAILICNTVSEMEAQGFINQGISVYPASEIMLPIQSNCLQCARQECPMNGVEGGTIAMCYGYLPESEFV